MLNELRVGVRLGEIEVFSFEFEGKVINAQPDGKLDDWPEGLFDHMAKQVYSLMTGRTREEVEEIRKNQS